MRALMGVLAWGVMVYAALVLFMAATQSRQIFLPSTILMTTPAEHGMVFEDVWLRTEDGVRLHGWWLPVPEARGTLLFLHGNAGNIGHRVESIRIFSELGLSVLIIDYRGYGQSEGQPSELGLYADARAAWAWLREVQALEPHQIVVFGRSLGSGVAARLAAELSPTEAPAAVMLESAFTSLADLGAELMPWLPVRLVLRHRFDTLDAITHVTAPVLIIHSRYDELIPFLHGERVFAAASEPRALLEIAGGHNDGFLRSRGHYTQGIDQFLREHLTR